MTTTTIDITGCRCVRCGSSDLDIKAPAVPLDEIVAGAVVCASCGEPYDAIWGVLFIGSYESEDFIGLVEIAANAGQHDPIGNPKNPASQAEYNLLWEKRLEDHHTSQDKSAMELKYPEIKDRYHRWIETHTLCEGISLKGRSLLDVGSGLGAKLHKFLEDCADVTALEYSPLIAAQGQQNVPGVRWFGGFSHVLPFQNNSFDLVFCQEALHHMGDIPAAMTEMLRVLRPNGHLVTSSDSFRPTGTRETYELGIFNKHPDVLSGVNERVPQFAQFTDTLDRYRDFVSPFLYTHMVYNYPQGDDGKKVNIDEFHRWDYDADKEVLSRLAGSICLKVILEKEIDVKPPVQETALLRPGQFAEWLNDQTTAMSEIAKLAPEQYVNLPFPGTGNTKFELMNGWQAKEDSEDYRQAYCRCRWYFSLPEDVKALKFEVLVPQSASPEAVCFTVMVNGRSNQSLSLDRNTWKTVTVPLDGQPKDIPFAVELQLQIESEEFADKLFRISKREFVSEM